MAYIHETRTDQRAIQYFSEVIAGQVGLSLRRNGNAPDLMTKVDKLIAKDSLSTNMLPVIESVELKRRGAHS